MLWVGVLPALSVFYVRATSKSQQIWVENRRIQRHPATRGTRSADRHIFKPGLLSNTLLACWWMASNFVLYYSTDSAVRDASAEGSGPEARPSWQCPSCSSILLVSSAMGFWGWVGDRLGRRWAMIIPAAIAVPLAPSLPAPLQTSRGSRSALVFRGPSAVPVQPVAELSVRTVPD